MRMSFILPVAAALAASTAASAQSLQQQSGGTFSSSGWTVATPGYVFRSDSKTSPRAPRPTAVLPLTAGECTRLGGEVSSFFACKSGKVCTREDENGKQHRVCLSKS